MSTNLDQTIRSLKKLPEAVVSVSSDHKSTAVDEQLREVQSVVRRLLRQKRTEVAIVILADGIK